MAEHTAQPAAILQPESELGLRKAALLLVSIPDDEAAFLLEHLSADQVKKIRKAVIDLRSVLELEQEVLAQELRRESNQSTETSPQTISHHPLTPSLDTADPTIIASVLRHELPQTAAATMTKMSGRTAAAVLTKLPTHQQIAVALRLAKMSSTDPASLELIVSDVEKSVLAKSSPPRKLGGEAIVAQILSYTDIATKKSMIANLAAEDRALTNRIVHRMSLLQERKLPMRPAKEERPSSDSRQAA